MSEAGAEKVIIGGRRSHRIGAVRRCATEGCGRLAGVDGVCLRCADEIRALNLMAEEEEMRRLRSAAWKSAWTRAAEWLGRSMPWLHHLLDWMIVAVVAGGIAFLGVTVIAVFWQWILQAGQ